MWIIALLLAAGLVVIGAMCASALLVGTALLESQDLSGLDLNQGRAESESPRRTPYTSHWVGGTPSR